MTHQSLKRWWGYCMAVSNARLDLSERVALWQLLIKMARWSSRSVLAETLEAVRTARAGRQARTSAGPH